MKKTYILGISAFYHDSAACIVCDGEIIAAAQEERFTRKKQDESFPINAIEYCLKEAGITKEEIDYVAFYDKPWLKFERLLETYLAYAPSGLKSYLKAIPIWIKEKLWTRESIRKELDFKGDVVFPEHHESHAASAFFPSPYDSAAILCLDGVGEWATTSWGVGKGNKMKLIGEIHFPHSLGMLYSAFTYYTGFKVNSGEYKVMGLAPYGEPKYKDLIMKEIIDLKEDGSYRLNMKYFNYCKGLTMTSPEFDKLFGGPPRQPESPLTQREMDLARSVQEVTEEVVIKIARHIQKTTGEKNLVLAGGVALNCVANGKLLRENIFENIWIQPAAGDAGGALGAALYTWYQVLENKRVTPNDGDMQKGTYLGPQFSSEEIESWLKEKAIPYQKFTKENVLEEAADLLASEKVLGWFSGRMEFGPRALGARSILGDARSREMQKTMNLKIKYRESFRPFAPACLREDVSTYFDFEGESPYMLQVAPVREERRMKMTESEDKLFGIEKLNIPRSDLPAITHIDYSARLQTVSDKTNPSFYKLIENFKKRTGYGIIVNTSFNVRGEPIVCSPEDAYRCFMRTEMDALVLENFIVYKADQPVVEKNEDWKNEFVLD